MVMQRYSPGSGQMEEWNDNLGSSAIARPIGIILNPSGLALVTAGELLELTVTVTNQGSVGAIIDIFIAETSEPVRQWCVSPRERLALSPEQASEVVFQILIPADAIPGTYDYSLVVDAPQHYPEETPIDFKGRLQVMPFVQEARTVSDPTFTLQPLTSSVAPALLQAGQPLELQVSVHNRSDRVDRFYLTCPDLDPTWFTVIYPQGYLEAGMVMAGEGLELNPGDRGEILLFINPPPDTWAGIYAPTVRLYSANNPDLVLLDVIYLKIAEIYLLNAEFVTLLGKIKHEAGLFELRFHNMGNTARNLVLRAKSADEDDICTYTLAPPQLQLLPGTSASVGLQVKPTKGWRPFFGRLINFVVEVEDPDRLPLINDRFQASLFWEPRPWWQFLPIVILLSGTVAALIFLIWWLLTRPPLRPKIVQFYPESNTYRELNNEAIRLNFNINNLQEIQSLRIVGVSPDGIVKSGPFVYDFTTQFPEELDRFCTKTEELICRNVWTDARQAGDYIFELTAIPTNEKVSPETIKTNPIRILPIPQPKILEFSSTQPVYQQRLLPPATPSRSDTQAAIPSVSSPNILLNWKISNPNQIQQIRIIGLAPDGSVQSEEKRYEVTQGLPNELQQFCQKTASDRELLCTNVPTDARQPGDYIFQLSVVPTTGNLEQLPTQNTNTIKIQPQKIPSRIIEFTLNGQNAPPKVVRQLNPQQTSALLSWKVEGGQNIKVELLPAPGTVPREGKMPYPLAQQPGSETITLQVTDREGNQLQRSVIIETLPPPPPPEPVIVPPPTAVPQAPALAQPGTAPGTSPEAGAGPVPTPEAGAGTSPSPEAATGTVPSPEAATGTVPGADGVTVPAPPPPGVPGSTLPSVEIPVPGANIPGGAEGAAANGSAASPQGTEGTEGAEGAEEEVQEPAPKFFEEKPLSPAELPPQFN